jgi:hypothetical protein
MNLEQHIGELEALGSLSALRLCYRIGNGCQDFSTMTKGDADFLKISVGQVRQDRDVDVVVGKGRRVSLNANVRGGVVKLVGICCDAISGGVGYRIRQRGQLADR